VVVYLQELDRGFEDAFVVHQDSLLLLERQPPVEKRVVAFARLGFLRYDEELRLKRYHECGQQQLKTSPWSGPDSV
jgi:hypothetical protein